MKKNYNENLVAGAAIRDDKGRRISKLFEAPHPKMTVGYARNLIMPSDLEDQEFNFRQAGGGMIEDGLAVIDKVKGNSVVWNQIIAKPYTFGPMRNSTFSSWYDGGSRSINDKGQFIFITNGGTTGSGNALNITPRNTHKYLLSYKVKADIASVCKVYKSGVTDVIANIAEADKWYFVSSIINNNDTNNYSSSLNAVVAANSHETTVTIDDAQVIDLTQMFGAGNEPSTYEEFLQRKPIVEDEFAYNEGTIVNNKVEKVVTTGRNLWDEQWELGSYDASTGEKLASSNRIRSKNMCACLPHTSYYWRIPNKANGSYMGFCYFYDISGAFISQRLVGPSSYLTVTTPSNARFVAFSLRTEYGTTYNHDICINLSDPSINGQYFPYEKHELDLSWIKDIKDAEGVKLFEDGMRSAGTTFDEVGKNKAIKRIGVMDMGKMRWYKREDISPNMFASNGIAPNNKIGLCPIASINKTDYDGTLVDGVLYWMRNYVMMYNSKFTTIDDFVNFVSGVPIYYELAEPIEVTYDEKNLSYPVVAGGTEEAIASEPTSAFRADIGYGIDAVKTILDLKARVEALEGK